MAGTGLAGSHFDCWINVSRRTAAVGNGQDAHGHSLVTNDGIRQLTRPIIR